MWPRRAALAALAVFVVSLAWTTVFYFAIYPTVPGLYIEFMGDRVDVGRFMDATDWNGRHLYVAITYTRNGTVNAITPPKAAETTNVAGMRYDPPATSLLL